jgi:hypothetical protein
MTKRGFIVAFGLAILLLLSTLILRAKQSPFGNTDVHMAEPELALPPGFRTEYDPAEKRYWNCVDTDGFNFCWRSFVDRDQAIREAQEFAKYLKQTNAWPKLFVSFVVGVIIGVLAIFWNLRRIVMWLALRHARIARSRSSRVPKNLIEQRPNLTQRAAAQVCPQRHL